MEIIQIVGLCIVTTILVVLLREDRPEIALQMSIIVGAIIFLRMIDQILAVIEYLRELSLRANINNLYISTVFKIIGIAYIAEFGSQICKDAGSHAIASKIEFGAKILILVLSLPLLMAVMDMVIRILP
ncbi:MAG: stage III sporulation protein AD [Tepidanaerobacteraceae bacterium]|jgi:stage III sporulation protein AD|nr:stage III sporulation protein AD [Tepidanaerobacter sp.]HQA60122.1 stage III sporulation protein AD [Tepidanaerobacteraceae bacterium]HQE04767.1 stage III sporulation protein AD [Tepidanaerobacteraceae bacterium]